MNGAAFGVMTFNTYRCGIYFDDGMQKIVKHVNLVNPDAVCFQVFTSCSKDECTVVW